MARQDFPLFCFTRRRTGERRVDLRGTKPLVGRLHRDAVHWVRDEARATVNIDPISMMAGRQAFCRWQSHRQKTRFRFKGAQQSSSWPNALCEFHQRDCLASVSVTLLEDFGDGCWRHLGHGSSFCRRFHGANPNKGVPKGDDLLRPCPLEDTNTRN